MRATDLRLRVTIHAYGLAAVRAAASLIRPQARHDGPCQELAARHRL